MAVRGEEGEDAYVTLLLTDTYLPGALVLAHSLRDAGTTKKLAVLVTLDSVSPEVITQLKAVYDYVFSVPCIRNEQPANLFLMNRPDLHSAFTKVNLWRQTQFRKIVYLDADVVAYRAPDELFDIKHPFAAAPDIGWPDLFNTGVMVLTPNMGDYYALMAMAERGISFDGADQGLLNMHFQNSYHRLPFTYNVTPSAHYQYVPAYRHFQSSINMVHFIGPDKPWAQGRSASTGSGPFDELAGRWWAVYDRHYRVPSLGPTPTQHEDVALVQYFVKGEYQPPTIAYTVPTAGQPSDPPPQPTTHHGQQHHDSARREHHEHHHHEEHHYSQAPPPHAPRDEQQYYSHAPGQGQEEQGHHHHHHHGYPQDAPSHEHHHQAPAPHSETPHSETPHFEGAPVAPANPSFVSSSSLRTSEERVAEARPEQVQEHQQWAPWPTTHKEPEREQPQPPPMQPSWDAQWHPPPSESRPEALNFPQTHYEMSSDVAPFVPPERYPSPPRNMWYEVPKEPPAPARQRPRPIFPWEEHQPQASRVFASEDSRPDDQSIIVESTDAPSGQSAAPAAVQAPGAAHGAPAESSVVTVSTVSEPKSEPATPTTPTALPIGPPVPLPDPWATFSLTNAWDEVPEIERYVDTLQRHRRGKASLGSGSGLRLPGIGDGIAGGFAGAAGGAEGGAGMDVRRRGSRLTDFPSEAERPSLPVTPAPIRRPRFWDGSGGHLGGAFGDGDEDEDEGAQHHHQLLPFARGVPAQSDWDPVAQLQKLARQQSELLQQKFGSAAASGVRAGGDDDDVVVAADTDRPGKPVAASAEAGMPVTLTEVLSPTPVKPSGGISPVQAILGAGEQPQEQVAGPRLSAPEAAEAAASMSTTPVLTEPSYHGPGVAWEKGEDIPLRETPMPPTEEDKDVLET